ncbi:MAG: hypothetical protein CAPSK01_001615 [Candidatus Accumulibacter vicinus]|uniref:Uncharacterized protein n=1 Tax=Candidatus Accumulibacter vicinus TaxID=2954382 RepID=A0A084Y217_9PROT|nr:MAG: hypothetical protein CAPSK01_001615 [Candidatus Accumulibacter vicinus]
MNLHQGASISNFAPVALEKSFGSRPAQCLTTGDGSSSCFSLVAQGHFHPVPSKRYAGRVPMPMSARRRNRRRQTLDQVEPSGKVCLHGAIAHGTFGPATAMEVRACAQAVAMGIRVEHSRGQPSRRDALRRRRARPRALRSAVAGLARGIPRACPGMPRVRISGPRRSLTTS